MPHFRAVVILNKSKWRSHLTDLTWIQYCELQPVQSLRITGILLMQVQSCKHLTITVKVYLSLNNVNFFRVSYYWKYKICYPALRFFWHLMWPMRKQFAHPVLGWRLVEVFSWSVHLSCFGASPLKLFINLFILICETHVKPSWNLCEAYNFLCDCVFGVSSEFVEPCFHRFWLAYRKLCYRWNSTTETCLWFITIH